MRPRATWYDAGDRSLLEEGNFEIANHVEEDAHDYVRAAHVFSDDTQIRHVAQKMHQTTRKLYKRKQNFIGVTLMHYVVRGDIYLRESIWKNIGFLKACMQTEQQ